MAQGLSGAWGEVAEWWVAGPTWSEVSPSQRPVFTPSVVRLRGRLVRAAAQLARHPRLLAGLVAARMPWRAMLAFGGWLDSAWALGITVCHIRGSGGNDVAAVRIPRSRLGPPIPERPRIVMAMIAQNEESVISGALDAVRPVVDEMLVMDGGSTDATAAVSEMCGARVVHRQYDNELAQRLALQAEVDGAWSLIIDADEVVAPALGALLGRAVCHPEFDVVFVPWFNVLGDAADPIGWPSCLPRLFATGLELVGRYHTQVTGYRRALYLPINGPYVLHRKDPLRHYRTALRYHELDPELFPQTPDDLAWIHREIARLESELTE